MVTDTEVMMVSGDYDDIQSVMKLIIRLSDTHLEYGVIGSPEFLLLSPNVQERLLSGWIALLSVYKEKLSSEPYYEEPQVIH